MQKKGDAQFCGLLSLFYRMPQNPSSSRLEFLSESVKNATDQQTPTVSPVCARSGALFAVMLLAGIRHAEVLKPECQKMSISDSHILSIKHGKGRTAGTPGSVPMTVPQDFEPAITTRVKTHNPFCRATFCDRHHRSSFLPQSSARRYMVWSG